MPSSGCQTCADRKSTRLNSSHTLISYAVFCLKKKKIEAAGRNDRGQVGQRHPPHTGGRRARGTPRPHGKRQGGAALPPDPGFPVFFFNDTATTEIYTLSLHDALPI